MDTTVPSNVINASRRFHRSCSTRATVRHGFTRALTPNGFVANGTTVTVPLKLQ